MVDALRQCPIAPALERPRRALERHPAGKRFGVDDGLAVDVRGRGGATQLDAPQVAGRPELATYIVGLPAVLQELRRIAPVTVILQPKPQPVLMARIAQPADVIEGNVVRSEEHTSELQSLRHLVCRL